MKLTIFQIRKIIKEELSLNEEDVAADLRSKPAIKDNVERVAQLFGTIAHRNLMFAGVQPGEKPPKNPKLDHFIDEKVNLLGSEVLELLQNRYLQVQEEWNKVK